MAIGTTILVRDLLFRVSTLLQDIAPTQFVHWSERELVALCNDGQRAIAKFMPIACTRLDAVKLAPGTRQSIGHLLPAALKPADGSTPTSPVRGILLLDVVRNMGANGLTPGLPIRVIPREILDNTLPAWHSTEATSIEHFTFDPRLPEYFYVSNAVPAATAVWVEVAYAANPDEIPYPGVTSYAADGSNPLLMALEDKYVDDLVNYVVARAYMKDAEVAGNVANAQLYTQMFTASINAQVQALTGQSPNLAFLPFSPQMYGAAR